jgi:putative glutamine amidotransferase
VRKTVSPPTQRPLIAVAWPRPDYLHALERAGGEPRVLQADNDPLPEALEGCDGVLLTGGVDVDPQRYGETDKHDSVEIDPKRDEYEFALTRAALDRGLPLFAICRGAQLLNVVAGGTLVQDIPSSMPSPLIHRRPQPPKIKKTDAHGIDVVPKTTLASLLKRRSGNGSVAVNSRHHQSVRTVAPGFVVSATAPDGIIEAIEKPSGAFCLGVQWHPENYWRTGEFAELFEGLVAAALAHRERRARKSAAARGRVKPSRPSRRRRA